MRRLTAVLVLAVSACSVHVGRGQARNSKLETLVDDARAKAEEPRRDARREAKAKQEAAWEEEARQSDCRSELVERTAARDRKRREDSLQEALAACPASGIPAGTYKTADGLPFVELQVTESGCASYDAFTRVERHQLRGLQTRLPFITNTAECIVGGTVGAEGRPKHSRYEGDCLRQIFDVLAEDSPFVVTPGTSPTVVVTTSESPRRRVVLTRVSETVPETGGVPTLWAKQRTESVTGARVSVALAQPGPNQGTNFDCLYALPDDPHCKPKPRDYCGELQRLESDDK